MKTQRIRNIYAISLMILDALLVAVAFVLAHRLRLLLPFPAEAVNLLPFREYTALMVVHIFSVIIALLFNRQYYIPRAVSRVDQLYAVSASVSIGTVVSVAVSAFFFKGTALEADYPRVMVIYAWLFSILFIMLGRAVHQVVRNVLRDRGVGKDRLLIVGTGDIARIIIQRILWSPQLGYELVGAVSDPEAEESVLGLPVLGPVESLPELIDEFDVDEVIVAIPDKGHR